MSNKVMHINAAMKMFLDAIVEFIAQCNIHFISLKVFDYLHKREIKLKRRPIKFANSIISICYLYSLDKHDSCFYNGIISLYMIAIFFWFVYRNL